MNKILKNEKGFSLVELIIVIAIMAVLVGIITPQYLRYVEQARVAADEEIIDEFSNVLLTLATEDGFELAEGKAISIRFYTTGSQTGQAYFTDVELKDNQIFKKVVDTSKVYKLKSSTYKGKLKEIKLKNEDGVYSVALVYEE